MDNLHDLFEHELKDIYDAEKRLVQALQKQADESTSPEVRDAFETHLEETRGQVERLEEVFKVFGKRPSRGEGCAGIMGLIQEHDNFAREDPAPAILDVFNIGAATKVERYEITAYESLIKLAGQIGLDDAIEPLEANLEEEEATLEILEEMSDEDVLLAKVSVGKPQRKASAR